MVYNPNPGGLNLYSAHDNQTQAPGFVGGGSTLANASQAPLVPPAPAAGAGTGTLPPSAKVPGTGGVGTAGAGTGGLPRGPDPAALAAAATGYAANAANPGTVSFGYGPGQVNPFGTMYTTPPSGSPGTGTNPVNTGPALTVLAPGTGTNPVNTGPALTTLVPSGGAPQFNATTQLGQMNAGNLAQIQAGGLATIFQ